LSCESAEASAPGTPPGSSWAPVVAYAALAAATQMLWLSYAAITTASARRYGVSVTTIGWLSEIFPLLYVLLAIPAGALLDRHFRPTLSGAAMLLAAGAIVRVCSLRFSWALGGQLLVAVSQPVILSAVGRVAGEYLQPADRANGIAIGSAGNFIGMLVALALGPLLAADGQLGRLLAVQALLALLAAGALLAALRRPALAGVGAEPGSGGARVLWRRTEMRTMCGLVFLGFGIFVALATWLQTLLHPAGVSDTTAGVVLVAMVIAGTISCAVVAPRVTQAPRERRYMLGTVAVTFLACVVCALTSALGARALVLVLTGWMLLAALPIVLSAAERIAGPLAASAGALVWLAGNLGGLAVAVIVQLLVHHPRGAFLAMAAISLLGLPLALRLGRVRAAPA
jgi:predicted MFS family arabinose efflux permease